MPEESFKCFKCKNSLESFLGSPIGRGSVCEKCLSDVKCCFNCQHYDQDSYNSCKESQAERVVDKDRSNFCDWFKPGNFDTQAENDSKEDALRALENLFKT